MKFVATVDLVCRLRQIDATEMLAFLVDLNICLNALIPKQNQPVRCFVNIIRHPDFLKEVGLSIVSKCYYFCLVTANAKSRS